MAKEEKQSKKNNAESEEKSERNGKLVAKRDFILHHNGYKKDIKEGDDLSDVPPLYHANLKTEKVL